MIASFDERKVGTGRYLQEMQDFTDLITDMNLVDVQTTNGKFTWNNRRGGIHQIASRLDRYLVSEDFVSLDIFYEASIMPFLGSDHWPIRLEVDVKKQQTKRPFHFEGFWLRDASFIQKFRG